MIRALALACVSLGAYAVCGCSHHEDETQAAGIKGGLPAASIQKAIDNPQTPPGMRAQLQQRLQQQQAQQPQPTGSQ